MGKKTILLPYTLFSAQAMTGTLTSSAVGVRYLDSVGIQLSFTGAPIGVFTVEATIDGSTWTALDFGSAITASAAADSHMLDLEQVPFDQLRLKYVHTSGAGSLSASIMSKSVGG